MATTMGGVSSAMVGLTFSRSGGSTEGRVISRRTVDMISAVYVPLAVMMVAYALFMFTSRSTFMRKKQVGRGGGRAAVAAATGRGGDCLADATKLVSRMHPALPGLRGPGPCCWGVSMNH